LDLGYWLLAIGITFDIVAIFAIPTNYQTPNAKRQTPNAKRQTPY